MKTGLYIGRFQPFHNGHKLVVDTMLQEVDVAIICIGISQGNDKNPYDYNTRLHFLTHIYSNIPYIYIFPLTDSPSDIDWVKSIAEIPFIQQSSEIILYCGDRKNDSAVQVLESQQHIFSSQILRIREVSRSILPHSGTQIREEISQSGIESVDKKIPSEVSEILKKQLRSLDF